MFLRNPVDSEYGFRGTMYTQNKQVHACDLIYVCDENM